MKKNSKQIVVKVEKKAPTRPAGQKKMKNRGINPLSNSPYFQTLLSPARIQGVKIPDATTTPSDTTCLETRAVLTPVTDSGNAKVVAGVAVNVGSLTNVGDIYTITASASDVYTWSGGAHPSAASMATIATMARPVSASLSLTCTAAEANDAGRFIACFVPGGSPQILVNVGVPTVPTTPALILATPAVTTVPVNKKLVECRYTPSDAIAQSYSGVRSAQASAPVRTTGATTISTSQYGWLIIIAESLSGVTVGLEYQLFENMEFIPSNTTVSLTAAATSYSDPIENALVSNAISDIRDINILQSLDDTLGGGQENWVPSNLRSTGPSSTGRSSSRISRTNPPMQNMMGLIPLGLAYGAGKSGLLDKIPILGDLLKGLGGT